MSIYIKRYAIFSRSVGPFGPPNEVKGMQHFFFLFQYALVISGYTKSFRFPYAISANSCGKYCSTRFVPMISGHALTIDFLHSTEAIAPSRELTRHSQYPATTFTPPHSLTRRTISPPQTVFHWARCLTIDGFNSTGSIIPSEYLTRRHLAPSKPLPRHKHYPASALALP